MPHDGIAPPARLTVEVMSKALRDFRFFASFLSIKTKEPQGEGALSFGYANWHGEQKQFHRELTGHDIILKPRQIGFSTWQLAYDVWFAIRHRNVNVVVMIHDEGMADEMFATIQMFADQLEAVGMLPPRKYSSKREIVFKQPHGSAIRIKKAGETEKTAAKQGRSATVHLLHATEVSFWGAAHKTMAAILNSVPDTGRVVIESTANGVGNLFHQDVLAAESGRTRDKLHFFPWYQHKAYRRKVPEGFDPTPRDEWEIVLLDQGIDLEQLAWWRERVDDPKKGLEATLQEYPPNITAAFRSNKAAYIEARHIDAASVHVRKPLRVERVMFEGNHLGDLRIYEEPQILRSYIVAGDVAEGVGADRSTMTVIDHATARVCAVYANEHIDAGDFGQAMAVVGGFYNFATVAPERNNHGAATLDRLVRTVDYPNLFVYGDGRRGWHTNTASRPIMFSQLATGIRDGSIWTPDGETLSEAATLIHDKDGQPRAQGKANVEGCKDDLYVSWAIAEQVRSTRDP